MGDVQRASWRGEGTGSSRLTMAECMPSRISEPMGIAVIGHVPEGFPKLAWPIKTSHCTAFQFEAKGGWISFGFSPTDMDVQAEAMIGSLPRSSFLEQ